MTRSTLEVRDNRSFFEKTLALWVKQWKITGEKVQEILEEGGDGIIQIAEAFSTPYLRPRLESARDRMVALVSLYLENESQGSFERAINLINQKEFLELSKWWSDMIKKLWGIMEVDDLMTKEDNIKNAYKLFSKAIPWNEGGVLPGYQTQFTEHLKRRKKLLFTKKLVELAWIQDFDFWVDTIEYYVFLPVITGKTLESEYLESFESGEFDKNKWATLLAKLDSDFSEFCKEYSFKKCEFLISDRIKQKTEGKSVEEQADEAYFDKQNNLSSEWNLLFPKGQRHTVTQYITAALTGAIDGKMKKSITREEFIGMCEKARKQQMPLSQLEGYISKNATPSLDLYGTIIDRLDREWRGILAKKAPINRRTYELQFLIQHIDISK